MQDPPTDPRLTAMLTTLFGDNWQDLEDDVTFEKTSMDSWVHALQTMLRAADGADPIRVALRNLMQEAADPDASQSAMPSRTKHEE